jgi:hypothetical protein
MRRRKGERRTWGHPQPRQTAAEFPGGIEKDTSIVILVEKEF